MINRDNKAIFTAKILIMSVLIAIWIIPLMGVLVNSFRPFTYASSSGWWKALSERAFTLDNYRRMVSQKKFALGLKNSVIITIPTVFFVILFSSLASYALFFTAVPGRKKLYAIIGALIIIPAEITLAPTLLILKSIGLQNTYPGIWLSHTAATIPFGIFLLGAFMAGIPKELTFAAKIDGAGIMQIYSKIVVPLSIPSMTSLAIFDFLWVWNDLLRAIIVIPDSKYRPLTAVLANAGGGYGEHITVQAAGAILLLLPPLLFFLLTQKSFESGAVAGAVKG